MHCIRAKQLVFVAALSLWTATVSYGVASLLVYDTRPGLAATAPAFHSQGEGQESFVGGKPFMQVFLHPHCPCSLATVQQLETLLANGPEIECRVYVVIPPEAGPGWENTSLLQRVQSIPGVRVKFDFGGVEAKRFGVATSGQVLLYERDRSLTFSGGITVSRGHSGESLGARAILALLAGRSTVAAVAPVYGCPLLNAGSLCQGVSPCKE